MAQGRPCVFSFKEPPYFTAEPARRIVAKVEEAVDIACRAMGECGGGGRAAAGGGADGAFAGAKWSSPGVPRAADGEKDFGAALSAPRVTLGRNLALPSLCFLARKAG